MENPENQPATPEPIDEHEYYRYDDQLDQARAERDLEKERFDRSYEPQSVL